MKRYFYLLCTLVLLSNCDSETSTEESKIPETVKFSENDPFQHSITESQFFEIDPNQDNILEGNKGTVIAAPKGCFLDAEGNPVIENIQIELTECLSIEEMLLSNLTTTSEGKPLETDGMVYINATANGQQLRIDKENPIYIEIPTDRIKEGMQVYKGTRDENGNMDWTDPKDLENYLVALDFELLDFLPPGFSEAVQSGMPFRNYKKATKELIDSLYFSLSASDGSFLTQGFQHTDYNEAYYNDNQVVDGKYTDDSYVTDSDYYDISDSISTDVTKERQDCGIDPAKIKVLKSEEFERTLISTREFEQRLKMIFRLCRPDIIDIYVNNLEKDLWEIDKMVADQLRDDAYYHSQFIQFYREKKTNVEGGKKYAKILKSYYESELKKIKTELEEIKEQAIRELQAKNEVTKNVATEYKALLFKRETYRMEKYGFEWSETGWLNIDNGTLPKTWGPQRLEIFVEKGKNYDRVYTYVVYTSLKSLYRLNTNDGERFYVGNQNQGQMLMPKKKAAIGITIAYNGETPFLGVQEFITGDPKVNIALEESTMERVKQEIKPFDNYSTENRIDVDLNYMAFFAKERERQKALKSEQEFIEKLWWIAFPCCERTGECEIGEKKITEGIN